MSAIADGIDFLFDFTRGKVGGKGVDRSANHATAICYVGFVFAWFQILGNFSSMDFSALATAASLVQCLGFLLLSVRVHAAKSVGGISSKMLVSYVGYLTCRLCSTTMKNGYLPVDATGDFIYQSLDFCSLCLVLHILYSMHKTYAYSYQEEYDTLPLMPFAVSCIILGLFVHGNMNKSFFFDSVWMMSSNFEAFAMVPQMWMMAKIGGKVDTEVSHFMVCTVVSSVMTFTFWWCLAPELAKRGPSLAYPLIIILQSLKLFLGADFMYYYTLAMLGGTQVVLPNMSECTEM